MPETETILCTYCERELTPSYGFSYGVPGIKRVFACHRDDCKPYQNLRVFEYGPFHFRPVRCKNGILLIGKIQNTDRWLLEASIDVGVDYRAFAKAWALETLNKWMIQVNV